VVAAVGETAVTVPAMPKLVLIAVPPGLLLAVAVVVELALPLTVVELPANAGPASSPKDIIVKMNWRMVFPTAYWANNTGRCV
jgi:hypothetical protein